MRYMSGGRAQVPLVIRTQQGGGRGNAAQHSQSLETFFTHIPGLKVVLPATPYDAKGLLKTAFREPNPVVFIEHKLLYNTKGPVPDEEYTIPLGKADTKRAGDDVTLVSLSRTVLLALEAAELAAKDGISVEVIDLRCTCATGHRRGDRVGQENQPVGGGARIAPASGHRRRNRRARAGTGLRLPGRAHRAGGSHGYSNSIQQTARGRGAAGGGSASCSHPAGDVFELDPSGFKTLRV